MRDCRWFVGPKRDCLLGNWIVVCLDGELASRKGQKVATRKLDQLDSATSLGELKVPPNNNLELLSGDRAGQYSIRINKQYRICFVWADDGPADVEITDYH